MPIREGLMRMSRGSPVLLANRCGACGSIQFPPAQICLSCLAAEPQTIELPSKGKLFSFTVVHMPSTNFPPGHTIGYVELLPKVRIFAPLRFGSAELPEIGQQMMLEFAPLWNEEGRDILAYRFCSRAAEEPRHA